MPLKISKTNFQSAGNPWLHQEFEYKTWYWKEKSWWSFKIGFSAKDRILKIRIENKRSWREGKKEFGKKWKCIERKRLKDIRPFKLN